MAESRVDILLALKSELKGSGDTLDFLQKLTGGLTLAGAAYGALSANRAAGQLASEIKALSAEANLSTDAFQALKIGAMGFNLSQETIVRGAVTLRKNLQDAAADGASPLNLRLAELRLTAAGLQALAPERQFEAIGRAILNASDKEQAFNAALELMGTKNAPKLIEMLKSLGADGFDKLAQATKAITLTPAQLEILDKAANNWDRIVYAAKVLGAMGLNALAGKEGPSPFALTTQIAELEKRIASYEAHGRADDPRAQEYRRTLGILQARLKTEQDTAKATAETAKNENEAKMHAAELKATLDSLEQSSLGNRQRIAAQDQKVYNEVQAEAIKGEKERERALESLAERFKNLADPMREYRRQLEEIELLRTRSLLTDQEAAAATKAVTQAMMDKSSDLGMHTAKLSELAEQRQLIQGNPFLSVDQKQSMMGRVLQAENIELDRQIRLLREKTTLQPDEARMLDGLVKRRTSNQFDPSGFSFGQQVAAGVQGFANSFGTQAEQVAGTINNTIGRSVDAIGQGIAGWMTGTTTWGQVLTQLETGILSEIISAGLRMGAQMIINATIGRTIQASMTAATLATTAATAAGISAMMIGPATLSTIASFGAAAAQAPASILAAQAAALPLGLFYEGGHTGPGGIVHANEWVAPNWMVQHPMFGSVIDGLEAARTGGAAAAPLASAGGKPTRMIHVMARDRSHARQLERDPEFDNVMLDWAGRNQGALVS